jgi:hypothetical protein
MNDATKTKREWCAMLAKLTCPMDPSTATAAFVAMLPMLDFTDEAFNRATLTAAARRDPGDAAIPNFDRISRALGEWQRSNRPAHLRLGANPAAAQIAHELPPPDPGEKARIGEALALLAENMRQAAYAKSQRPEVKPAYLTGEHLAAVRATYGIPKTDR